MQRCFLLALVSAMMASPAVADSLLRNSGFDETLAPWECDEGKLAPDPEAGDNQVLRIELEDGVFGLAQALQWSADKKKLTLSFRARASQASKKSPIQLRVRIYDQDDNSEIVAAFLVETSREWIVLREELEWLDFKPVSFLLESNRGEGILWIDELKLE